MQLRFWGELLSVINTAVSTPDVLARVAANDALAMRDCIERYGGLVWSLARRCTYCPADAEDATQEIFVKLWQYAYRFDATKGSETTFICLIARRLMIDRLRQRRLELLTSSFNDDIDDAAGATSECRYDDEIDALRATGILARLRHEHRQVLELAFHDGLTQSEIAETLQMPLGTVKSAMRRGLLAIRAAMTRAPHHEAAATPTTNDRRHAPFQRRLIAAT